MGGISMKKILALLITGFFTMPAFASCSIDANEPCTASALNENQTLQEKLLPDPLEEIKEPDAFQPQYHKPYYDELINTTPATATNTNNYNANCQFGVCLPGSNNMEGELTE